MVEIGRCNVLLVLATRLTCNILVEGTLRDNKFDPAQLGSICLSPVSASSVLAVTRSSSGLFFCRTAKYSTVQVDFWPLLQQSQCRFMQTLRQELPFERNGKGERLRTVYGPYTTCTERSCQQLALVQSFNIEFSSSTGLPLRSLLVLVGLRRHPAFLGCIEDQWRTHSRQLIDRVHLGSSAPF